MKKQKRTIETDSLLLRGFERSDAYVRDKKVSKDINERQS